jgi:hypothetical protein
MQSALKDEIEEHIRTEFRHAFDELQCARDFQKADAAELLNRATRRLYDFVGHGKIPPDLQRLTNSELS